jgi:hypothetical protein
MIHLHVQQKTVPEFEVVTSDNRDINDILEEISRIAHERLLMSSMDRQDLEDIKENAEPEDIINTLESIIDYLEGGFCRILDELKD